MKAPIAWLFIGAFIAFAAAFMLAPTLMLAVQSLTDDDGFTWANFAALGQYRYSVAFENSTILSLASSAVGSVFGALIAYLVIHPGAPRGLRSLVTSFSAVAANFGGVPLAFAFISSLGTLGLLTTGLKSIGIDIYALGFNLFSLGGLTLVYAYFQIPLMVIIITPALLALRSEWREATENLGASAWQYWRMVGLPVLAPSLLAGFLLLFGSAFSAYATAYSLTAGNIGLVTTEVGNVLSGNVEEAPGIGASLSMGMIGVMLVVLVVYAMAGRSAARWQKR